MDRQSAKGLTSLALCLLALALCVSVYAMIVGRPTLKDVSAALQQRDEAIKVLAIAIKDLQEKHKEKGSYSIKGKK